MAIRLKMISARYWRPYFLIWAKRQPIKT